jgi:hypothetical protein
MSLKALYWRLWWPHQSLVNTFSQDPPNGTALKSILIAMSASVSYASNAIRMVIALAMLLVFVFRRWISSFANLVWRRLIENKLPAFTLILSGVGAIAGAVKGLLDIFWPDKALH